MGKTVEKVRDGGWPAALLEQWKISILNVICKEHEGVPVDSMDSIQAHRRVSMGLSKILNKRDTCRSEEIT